MTFCLLTVSACYSKCYICLSRHWHCPWCSLLTFSFYLLFSTSKIVFIHSRCKQTDSDILPVNVSACYCVSCYVLSGNNTSDLSSVIVEGWQNLVLSLQISHIEWLPFYTSLLHFRETFKGNIYFCPVGANNWVTFCFPTVSTCRSKCYSLRYVCLSRHWHCPWCSLLTFSFY